MAGIYAMPSVFGIDTVEDVKSRFKDIAKGCYAIICVWRRLT